MKPLLLILSLIAPVLVSAQSRFYGKGLIVDGEPFIMLAGELHNSSTGSVENMAPIWERMAAKGLNTVFAVISWELLEPQEGRFDYTILDNAICGARKAGLKLGILWFGSWKNGESMYAPSWVKTDGKRFPRACFLGGEKMNCLSTLADATKKADAKAFAAMMRHIKEIDNAGTVVLVQVENEIGTVDFPAVFGGGKNRCIRDYSPLGDKAFKGKVPQKLMSYLSEHYTELQPALSRAWTVAGKKSSGTWEEVFGKGQPRNPSNEDFLDEYPYFTEEIFMAWNYATYVEEVAHAGKREYDIPMYVNAWLKQSSGREPGMYPCGAALPHVFDIWRCAAPSIDFYAPDIYAIEVYEQTCERFSSQGNPLFIPETTPDAAGAARLFYTLGKFGARCYSPFGIDGLTDDSYDKAYALLKGLMPMLKQYIGTDSMTGLLCGEGRSEDSAEFGAYRVNISSTASALVFKGDHAEASNGSGASEVSGAMVIRISPDEFILAGFGDMKIDITKSSACKSSHVTPLSVDELRLGPDGKLYPHRLNGDEVFSANAVIGAHEAKAFLIKMYQY